MSVSIAPKVIELAEKAENKSRFFENSVLSMQALGVLVEKFKSKEMSLEEYLEEIEDMADAWQGEFDESEDFDSETE